MIPDQDNPCSLPSYKPLRVSIFSKENLKPLSTSSCFKSPSDKYPLRYPFTDSKFLDVQHTVASHSSSMWCLGHDSVTLHILSLLTGMTSLFPANSCSSFKTQPKCHFSEAFLSSLGRSIIEASFIHFHINKTWPIVASQHLHYQVLDSFLCLQLFSSLSFPGLSSSTSH